MTQLPRFIPTNRLERYDLVNEQGQDLGQVQNFVVDMPKNVLEKAPGMNKDKWMEEINSDFLANCYLHYGLAPYWDSSLSPEEQIKGLGYAIWEREGRPTGRDAEHYFRAERILSVQGVIGSPSRKLQKSSTTVKGNTNDSKV